MSLEKYKGYFYDNEGKLIEFYNGYLDLEDMDGILEFRKNAIGFISHNAIDSNTHKCDLETLTIVEI